MTLVAEIRPCRASSRMARLMPSVMPKSSAQSTTGFTGPPFIDRSAPAA
jgi:hypothetical protein